MSKDPAFLFYTSDFLTGTMFMNNEQTGKYIRLLCAQHQHGHLTEDDMIKICGNKEDIIFSKFEQLKDGKYHNKRLHLEIEKRNNFCNSRRKNRLKGKVSKSYNKGHMSNICKSYVEHMENEDENINSINSLNSIPPNLNTVLKYISDNKYNIDGEKWYNFYQAKGWMIGKNKMKNWHAAIRTWIKKETEIDHSKDYLKAL